MHSYIAKHAYEQHGISTHQPNHAFKKKKTQQLRDIVTLTYSLVGSTLETLWLIMIYKLELPKCEASSLKHTVGNGRSSK